MSMMRFITVLASLALILWCGAFALYLGRVDACYNNDSAFSQTHDGIIVLTGGAGRVNTGLDLLKDRRGQYLLITGAHPYVRIEELINLWDGQARTLDQHNITLGQAAGNTQGNAYEAHNWIIKNDIRSALLVTGRYHMPRSLLEFNSVISETTLTPYPVCTASSETSKLAVFKEFNKWLLTYIRLAI